MALDEIGNQHIVPVHVKDNEQTLSHIQFIESVSDVAISCFGSASEPQIRVSHPIKGRIPEARNKPAKELLPSETTLYYERMAWMINFPEITAQIGKETLELAIGGVKAYNLDNLYSTKDALESFKLFIGFKNMVCTNLCVATDGFKSEVKVNSVAALKDAALNLFHAFDVQQQADEFSLLREAVLTEEQFAHVLGKIKLYNSMPKEERKDIPEIGLSDSQLSAIAEDYYTDASHGRDSEGNISLWNIYNLFTGANKSSYIDTFLDRNIKVYQGARHLFEATRNPLTSWYLN